MENMTAKVSCFTRAYHYKNNENWIFKDDKAAEILGEKEYQMIAEHMTQGIQFFQPDFNGTKEEIKDKLLPYGYQQEQKTKNRLEFVQKSFEYL